MGMRILPATIPLHPRRARLHIRIQNTVENRRRLGSTTATVSLPLLSRSTIAEPLRPHIQTIVVNLPFPHLAHLRIRTPLPRRRLLIVITGVTNLRQVIP